MPTITEFFQQSELALAAYGQLFSGITGDSYISALQEAELKELKGSASINFSK